VAKYEPLEQFLKSQTTSQVPMTFSEIERLLEGKLPTSAYRHRPWWANEAAGHSHAKAWLAAGYETAQVDMTARKLVFRRKSAKGRGGMSEPVRPFLRDAEKPARHPLFGLLKGMFTITPDTDITRPAMPEWADMIDRDYGKERG
jgi:hypothetical protein